MLNAYFFLVDSTHLLECGNATVFLPFLMNNGSVKRVPNVVRSRSFDAFTISANHFGHLKPHDVISNQIVGIVPPSITYSLPVG